MSLDKKLDAVRPAPMDAWDTPKETWQFVTIPEEDSLGGPFPRISLNKEYFEAGKTYQVPAQIASYVLDRIKVHNRASVRLLQPNVDMKAIGDINNSPNAIVLGNRAIPIDATKIQTL